MATPLSAATPIQEAARLEPALRRYFRRRAAPHEIDDLIQEVFIHLQRRRSTEPVQDIDRYVFVVAGNVLVRHYRRERRWVLGASAHEPEIFDATSPERALLEKEELQSIVRTISGLPPRTQEIFVLHRFDALTYSRIAASLGISQKAVEKHMSRALRALTGAASE
jgi:RNA polymerase sigma-70 factor (ECF subfamily)